MIRPRVPFSVSLPRRAPLRIACLCAAAVCSAVSAAQPPADPAPPAAAVPSTPAAEPSVLEKVRAAYLSEPTTERLRISVRHGELPPRRSLLLVRLEPASDARSIRRAVLRAGRLLIEAVPGRVAAMLDAPDSGIFMADTAAADIAQALAEALPPLPLAPLDFAAAQHLPPTGLTPYGLGARFDSPDLRQKAGAAVFTGSIRDGSFKLTVDAATGRLRRLELRLGDPAQPERLRIITVEYAPSSADLSSIQFASGARPRAASLAQLAAAEPALAVGTKLTVSPDSAAHAVLRAALHPAADRARMAIVLIGGLPRAGVPAADASAACATLLALKNEVSIFLGGDRDAADRRGDVGFAALWHASGPGDEAALSRLADAPGDPVHIAGLAGAENELARLAPGSSEAIIVIAPDSTICAVHTLQTLPADPEQRIAELLMSYLDAAARYEGDPKQGR